MEELRVTNLLGGALAAITGAVVASFFGVFGTLAGAGVMSIFMALATAGYAHSLAAGHRWIRRTLLPRAGGDTDAGTPGVQPIRWQRVAVAAAVVFTVAMGAVTTVEAAAKRPLASQPQPGASTSVGVVVVVGQPAAPTPRAPGTSATSPPALAPTTTAPAGAATTTAPAGAVPTTAPSATAPTTTTPSTQAPTTQQR